MITVPNNNNTALSRADNLGGNIMKTTYAIQEARKDISLAQEMDRVELEYKACLIKNNAKFFKALLNFIELATPVVQQFDGKMYNVKFERAIKEIVEANVGTEPIWYEEQEKLPRYCYASVHLKQVRYDNRVAEITFSTRQCAFAKVPRWVFEFSEHKLIEQTVGTSCYYEYDLKVIHRQDDAKRISASATLAEWDDVVQFARASITKYEGVTVETLKEAKSEHAILVAQIRKFEKDFLSDVRESMNLMRY